ncbi:sulfite exporter TauE/SafE family protein [Hydrogenibacillus sp. N12]|uniref:sulfite exporter TauE/SafE family protein n=1 Tax=Hydrogenibacillus sp. N12 TaxID=2866627 RepID=UPI001C7CF816|nr:sulfite exporter TauE/SafE family protein [Hydrogenibacillus sp. N12]QZA34018.1 sulfite exporter TauE/SafE family protein [Hydrogenibacillus sp. N12]
MEGALLIKILVLALIGWSASFVSGMVGIGGAVIKYPMLLYLPPLLAGFSYSAHEVAGLNAIQVFFATLSAVVALRKEPYLNRSLVLYMGGAILLASFIGGFGAQYLSQAAVNVVFALLAVAALFLMFLPKKELDDVPPDKVRFNRALAVGIAVFVGLASGVVGAGGGFILVPLMLFILRIPTRMTIATSLAVTFLNSIGSTLGKVLSNQIIYWPDGVVLVIASMLGAPLGARLMTRTSPRLLQGILTALIALTVAKMWWDILLPGEVPADVPLPPAEPEN